MVFNLRKISIGRFVSIGSIFTAFAVLFQSAPLFLPMIGLVLSPMSTLPIALAAVINVSLGFTVFFSSIMILTLFSIQETIILTFTTGLLGIVLGTLIYRKGKKIAILLSSVALSIGIILITYIIRFSAFINLGNLFPTFFAIIMIFMFSLVYSSIWYFFFKKFVNYLMRIKLIKMLP